MASREAMLEVIGRAYDARAKGDIEGLMSAFHPDSVFELKGDKRTLAFAGASRGHSGVRATMSSFIDTFEFQHRDIVDTIVEGDRVVVQSRLKVSFAPKGFVFDTELIEIFRFKDGKIIELVEFADTALVRDIAGI